MLSLTGFKSRFTPNWRMSVLTLAALVLFTRLGVWQLERASEKKQMLTREGVFATHTPIAWQPGDKFPTQYQRINLQGHFLPQVLLFDNQHYQHQFGYHVISPLALSDGWVVLVDRGWVAGDLTRRELPMVDTPVGNINLTGSSYYPSDKNWLLGPLLEIKRADLAIVELIDTKSISQFLHKSVYPFIMRLSENEPYGFVREWAIVSMSPQRHYGYAVQWFAIAAVVLILFIALNFKNKYES